MTENFIPIFKPFRQKRHIFLSFFCTQIMKKEDLCKKILFSIAIILIVMRQLDAILKLYSLA